MDKRHPTIRLGLAALALAISWTSPHANTPGRSWSPTYELPQPNALNAVAPRLECNALGVPYLFCMTVTPYGFERFQWSDSAWAKDWDLARYTQIIWPVPAPEHEQYLVGQDWPSGNQFYLVHLIGDSYTMENIFSGDASQLFAAAVSPGRKWLVAADQYPKSRAFYSDSFDHWTEVPISGSAANGICVGAVDDTTAVIVWAGSEYVRWGLLAGSTWNPSPVPLYDGIEGLLSNTPQCVPRESGGLWVGWATQDPIVIMTSYRNGVWAPLDTITCNYRSPVRPEMRYSDWFQISRSGGSYPPVVWEVFDSSVGAEAVCVSVPTDSGWTTADQIDNDREGFMPSVTRDMNGDVWVAFGRFWFQPIIRWAHTYTKSFASAPVASNQGGQHLVSWSLTESSPETWWAVLRSEGGGDFVPIARVRATASVAMSYLDADVLGTDVHYRIRRESVDKRFEWLSDPSDSPVPALPSVANVQTAPGQVTLTWYAAGDLGPATVQRSSDGADWLALAPPASQGGDLLTFTDTGLEAKRYAYRLQVGSEFTPETWVNVPGFALALEGLSPNPAIGRAQVALTLLDDSMARLEVYSVTGRRVIEREVGSLGAGPHTLDLGGVLRPGVYWVRVTQAGRTISKKGVVTE